MCIRACGGGDVCHGAPAWLPSKELACSKSAIPTSAIAVEPWQRCAAAAPSQPVLLAAFPVDISACPQRCYVSRS